MYLPLMGLEHSYWYMYQVMVVIVSQRVLIPEEMSCWAPVTGVLPTRQMMSALMCQSLENKEGT